MVAKESGRFLQFLPTVDAPKGNFWTWKEAEPSVVLDEIKQVLSTPDNHESSGLTEEESLSAREMKILPLLRCNGLEPYAILQRTCNVLALPVDLGDRCVFFVLVFCVRQARRRDGKTAQTRFTYYSFR